MAQEKENKKTRTEFSEIGAAAALQRLFDGCGYDNARTLKCGTGSITAHKVMMEGVDFDLVYNPLKHLGYKAMLNLIGELYASLCSCSAASIVLGISSRFCYEQIEELWQGIIAAAKEHSVQELKLQLNPSVNGLYISIEAIGIKKRSKTACPQVSATDILCLSGNVGAAYLGQHVLEREKTAFEGAPQGSAKQPNLSAYKYLLSQYLCPEIPANTLNRLYEQKIIPSAGVFVTKGLAEAVIRVASESGFGAKLYLDKIPISSQAFEMAQEINMDPVTCALNGGDDYRLLYTIPVGHFEKFRKEIQTFDVIGHLCKKEEGCSLVTPQGGEILLKSL
ncbi:MAG: hypothetical protein HUJ90_03490 [Bacteroidales bacterium]|nr:hypothetical protein [Bacteroidales bacterium]